MAVNTDVFQKANEIKMLSLEQQKEINDLKSENEQLKQELDEAKDYKRKFLELNSWLITQVKIHEKIAESTNKAINETKVSNYNVSEIVTEKARKAMTGAIHDDVPAGGLTEKD